jgi:hypothetical protein
MMTSLARQRDEYVERADAAWRSLLEFVDALSPEQREEFRNADGWSVKDHIAHIAAWKRSFALWVDGISGHEVLGVDEDLFRRDDLDRINVAILEINRHRPWRDVRIEAIAAHEAWLAKLAAQPESRLAANLGSHSLIDSIADLTWEHDEVHLAWIREMLKQG